MKAAKTQKKKKKKKVKRNAISTLDNFKRKYQKHLCQLVLIYLITLNHLFWKLTKEKFTMHDVNFEGAAKIYTVFYQ